MFLSLSYVTFILFQIEILFLICGFWKVRPVRHTIAPVVFCRFGNISISLFLLVLSRCPIDSSHTGARISRAFSALTHKTSDEN